MIGALLNLVNLTYTAIIRTGRGESTPRHLRVYANYPNIVDFSDAENTTPHLNISLLEGETAVVEYPLKVAAFSSVHSLSLYFVSIFHPCDEIDQLNTF